jgi:uncharacterized membrane protein
MNATTETGDFKKWFVFSLITIGLIVIAILSFQGYQTSQKARVINESAQKLEKDTRESSELFKKLETIRKNENKIDSNNTENDSLKGEIREIAKDLPKYGIESKSKYLSE